MKEFNNILDFFIHVREHNLCTTPYCTTCGAMEYRNLCKGMGVEKVRELIEATTAEDIKNARPELWYDPFKILLIDGFICDEGCPMMQMYEMGYERLVYGDTMDLILEVNSIKVYAVTGSIFEKESVDVLGLFQNPGLAALPIKIDDFLREKSFGNVQNVLIPCDGKHGDVKAIYYVNTSGTHGDTHEVAKILQAFLDSVTQAGFSTIAMNGIKTRGFSESDNLRIIRDWALSHTDSPIRSILMVDKRAGFKRLANREIH